MLRKPQYKLSRRLGEKLFPKTQTQKYALRAGRKVTTGKRKFTQKTEYGQQFLDKQKVRYSYGVLEKQFVKYVDNARKHSRTNPAQGLYTQLESRLDNVVYRIGLTISRAAARQMVSHGHIRVNGVKISIPSHQIKPGDEITIRDASKTKTLFRDLELKLKNYKAPEWLVVDNVKCTGKVGMSPINMKNDSNLNFNSVIELYSRA
ncbi:MAG: 30S ribosomal protein S4 [Candidatus Vogelbacteria bacterium]|nr:30S ribosomal protein S4 [Candidatus Vogelbacteria bacterium]